MHIRPTLHHAVWLLALLVLAACSLSAEPPVVPTATLAATATATPTPTITPTPAPPTATPTPTVVPQVALEAGQRGLLNGDYEDALASYQLVLAQGAAAPQEAAVEAALGLGRAAIRAGRFESAVEPLTAFIDRYPASVTAPAYVLRGDAHLGLGEWAKAVDDYRQYLALEPGLIDSHVYERMGDAQLGMDALADAQASYAQAIDASRSLNAQVALRERLAQVHLSRGEREAALTQLEAILASGVSADTKARVELLVARTLLDSGEPERAMNRMRRIVDVYPQQPEAYAAMTALLAEGYELEAMQQARVAFAYGDYAMTARVLHDTTTRFQLAAIPAELYMLLGRAYRELGNPDAAVVAFQTVVEQYPRDPLFGDALLEQGHTRARAGDIPGALAAYGRIVTNFGYLPQAAEALWQLATLYVDSGQFGEARAAFEQLADAYPNTFQARNGLFLAAASAMTTGDLASAERLYGLLAVTATGEAQAAAYMSAGLLARRRGDERFAADALNQAVTAAPDSYYAARAQDRQAGRMAFAPPALTDFGALDDAALAEADDWLRRHFSSEVEGSLATLPPHLANDPRLESGRELWRLGAEDQARVEFADLMAAYQQDGIASYQLALFLRDLGAYADSIVAAANVVRAAGAGTLDVPVALSRLRYPAYYIDLVEAQAKAYDVDPLLLLAIIRHESLFDRHATDAAGGAGLLQLDRGTAAYIATQLDWPDFQHSDLTSPDVSIRFGAFYLAEQLERFDGSVVAALAALAAGPERAQLWYDISGGEPDVFMTVITLDSARDYVERVASYYNVYRALYGRDGDGNSAAD